MNRMGIPWTALMDMQPQRSYHIAWFVYGCIEREHVLNVSAYAEWWMRAIGISTTQFDGTTRHRSPSRVGPLP